MTKSNTVGALAGFRVIDLTRVLGGPFCTQLLSDHGAEVIKVEPPQGDEVRDWGPPFKDGLSAYFAGVNRNKRSIGLDMRTKRGQEILFQLLEGADVMIDNFKSGTLEKWGIGYDEVLAKRFPSLIYCSITGFGADGPFGGFPGYDAVAQALSGQISVNGSPETGPTRIGVPIIDLATGLYASIGILLAVEERRRSGLGQRVDTSLFDTGVALLHPQAANYFMSGKAPVLTGNSHPNISPYSQYQTKKGRLFMAIGNDRQFRLLAELLGHPEWPTDPRFLHNPERVENRDALDAEITDALRDHVAEDITMALLAKGVPAGAVLTIPEVAKHPHTKHREMVVELDGYYGTGIPVKMSRTPGSVRTTPPHYGSATRDVLAGLGYDHAQVDELITDGVVYTKRAKAPS
ncbi:MAG: CaiB/BaiF CoA-transferase family protein [Alphaproteobacteria bacterium]|jgi:formyl-CoA transferase|nr:CaiB/BaiF CoA-transferase family protein [Alphaproteobacteria bacterium]MDP6256430.1 CaiB/BaiF CoA-transferase family protein [Alphaproteobacteria bacterium]MDP7053149.1 CaiB/BaiF CoA-transferase family protein [Alphaproteobacteria bacterium]MDP7228572.1 CaiB/BaiF CoA-transferase family protein [Alphaproteobacteria bacterium]MDP7459178.1 CaiB/BaiF CoA-transferase family protein [Alphaproteobacteria bacterium]|tara:strand:- start:2675 stop:3889 length:1215 start_codon:yes stop_codon:yes gene_type:complete